MFLQEPQQMKQFLRAFILVQVEPMREKDVMEELLKMEEVIEAHMITGEYDVLAVVQARRHFLEADYDVLFNTAIAKIESVKYVIDTNTIIGIASKTKISDSVWGRVELKNISNALGILTLFVFHLFSILQGFFLIPSKYLLLHREWLLLSIRT